MGDLQKSSQSIQQCRRPAATLHRNTDGFGAVIEVEAQLD